MTEPKPKHTPEPWHSVAPLNPGHEQHGDRLITNRENHHIAETFQYRDEQARDQQTALANAARIVTCVNELAGLTFEPGELRAKLEAMGELVEAAETLLGNIGNVGPHDCPGFDCAKCQNPGVGWHDLRTAIAKFRGEES